MYQWLQTIATPMQCSEFYFISIITKTGNNYYEMFVFGKYVEIIPQLGSLLDYIKPS